MPQVFCLFPLKPSSPAILDFPLAIEFAGPICIFILFLILFHLLIVPFLKEVALDSTRLCVSIISVNSSDWVKSFCF